MRSSIAARRLSARGRGILSKAVLELHAAGLRRGEAYQSVDDLICARVGYRHAVDVVVADGVEEVVGGFALAISLE